MHVDWAGRIINRIHSSLRVVATIKMRTCLVKLQYFDKNLLSVCLMFIFVKQTNKLTGNDKCGPNRVIMLCDMNYDTIMTSCIIGTSHDSCWGKENGWVSFVWCVSSYLCCCWQCPRQPGECQGTWRGKQWWTKGDTGENCSWWPTAPSRAHSPGKIEWVFTAYCNISFLNILGSSINCS